MKIMNLKQFLAMPPGTLHAKYKPAYFEDMQVKLENVGDRDFLLSSFGPGAMDCNSTEDFFEKLHAAELDVTIDLPLDLDCVQRDGCFDDSQLFAVFSSADIEQMIAKLNDCLRVTKAKELG